MSAGGPLTVWPVDCAVVRSGHVNLFPHSSELATEGLLLNASELTNKQTGRRS